MFTKGRSDVASGVTGRLHEQAAAAAEYLVWSDRSACVRAGLDHGSIDEACWLDLVGEAQMITYQKRLARRRYIARRTCSGARAPRIARERRSGSARSRSR